MKTGLSAKAIELLISYNEHALTKIAPSNRPELDGLCVVAAQKIHKGTKLFDAPTAYNLDDEVELSSVDIKKYIYNKPALHFIATRFIPHQPEEEEEEEEGEGDSPVLFYSIPGGGPNSVTPSYFIGHAHDAGDTRANVTTDTEAGSKETDFCGLTPCIASRDIEIGEELVWHYDEDEHQMYELGKSFINDCIADENGLADAKNNYVLGGSDLSDGAKKIIDNLNSMLVMLKPSKVHEGGIGVFVASGANEIIREKLEQDSTNGVQLFKMPEGSTIHQTEDLPFDVIMDQVKCSVGLAKIGDHFLPSAFLSKDGVDEDDDVDDDEMIPLHGGGRNALDEIIPLHRGGPNALDSSHYCNSCVGTGRDSNASLLPFDPKKDSFSRIVVYTALNDDEEILLNYEFVTDKDGGNDDELNFDESNNVYDEGMGATDNADDSDYDHDSGSAEQKSHNRTVVHENSPSTQGAVLSMYESALLESGNFQSTSTKPPAREKFKVQTPKPSDVATSDDIEERHRTQSRYRCFLGRTMEERYQAKTGAPPLTKFSGASYTEKIMERSIYVAENDIGTDCPDVSEGMFKVHNVEKGTVRCQCMTPIKITVDIYGRLTVRSNPMQLHAKNCKKNETEFAHGYKCDCGFGKDTVPSYFKEYKYLIQHWRACKRWATLFDKLIEYKTNHPDETSVPSSSGQLNRFSIGVSFTTTTIRNVWIPRIDTVLYMSSSELEKIDTSQSIQYIDGLIAEDFRGELDVQWTCQCGGKNGAKRSMCSLCGKWKKGFYCIEE